MGSQKVNDDEYEIIDKGEDQFQHILLTDHSPYPGVLFQFGEVKLIEEDDSLRVKFLYEEFDNPKQHSLDAKFSDYIGAILIQNLEDMLLHSKLTKDKSGS